jgi:magnesium transporter
VPALSRFGDESAPPEAVMQGNGMLLDTVQKLLRRNAERNIVRILQRAHAADIALLLRHISGKDRLRVFKLVPDPDVRAEVLAESDPEIQDELLTEVADTELVDLLHRLAGDDAADIIDRLEDDRAEKVLAHWKKEEGGDVDQLLAYGPDTAGGIMNPDVFALPEQTTVREAIETLQANHEEIEMAFYLFVVNEHGHLVGVCSLRELVINDPRKTLAEIMTVDVMSVDVQTDQEEVARQVARYNLLALPVVDEQNRLVGLITVDDIIDVIREEATEDILKMAGAGVTDVGDYGSSAHNARMRMPWLFASFLGGIGSMLIITSFQAALAQVAILAAFIPITLGMGGNVGTQASTIVTRGIATGRFSAERLGMVVGREIGTGALLGLIYGIGIGLVATVTYHPHAGDSFSIINLALTVSLSLLASMTIAATVGGAVPLLFHRAGIDPAIATGPFVTTSVDLLGTTCYFVIGRFLLGL